MQQEECEPLPPSGDPNPDEIDLPPILRPVSPSIAPPSTQDHLPSVKERVPSLDLLRGIAVLLVLGNHLKWVTFGWVGVDLFFVLSGFLITGILLDTVKKPHYFRNFYARRALRIFPLYFLCVFIFARGAERIWMCLFLSNYHYAFILQHFWSMGIEEQFYLAWPLIVWVFRKRIWMIALILTALGVLFRYGELGSPYMDTFSRIYEPAVGGALCVLLRAKPHLSKYGSKALLLMVAFLTLLNVASSPWTWKLDPYVFVTLASCAAVTTAIHAQTRNRGLEWIGKYSYGIYVYHVILLFLFGDIGILLSFPVAFLSFHLFESPFLKLKKYFAYTTYTIPSHTIREQGQTS